MLAELELHASLLLSNVQAHRHFKVIFIVTPFRVQSSPLIIGLLQQSKTTLAQHPSYTVSSTQSIVAFHYFMYVNISCIVYIYFYSLYFNVMYLLI